MATAPEISCAFDHQQRQRLVAALHGNRTATAHGIDRHRGAARVSQRCASAAQSEFRDDCAGRMACPTRAHFVHDMLFAFSFRSGSPHMASLRPRSEVSQSARGTPPCVELLEGSTKCRATSTNPRCLNFGKCSFQHVCGDHVTNCLWLQTSAQAAQR